VWKQQVKKKWLATRSRLEHDVEALVKVTGVLLIERAGQIFMLRILGM